MFHWILSYKVGQRFSAHAEQIGDANGAPKSIKAKKPAYPTFGGFW